MKTHIAKWMRRIKRESPKELSHLFPATRPQKILFDHLPKCGGSSLNKYLEAHYPKRKTFSTDGCNPVASVEKFKSLSLRGRYKYALVKGHLAHQLLPYVHPDALKVTVLRDPVDRIISHYYYAKRASNHYLHAAILESGMSLETYATSDLSNELRNWYTTHFSGLTIREAEENPEEAVQQAVEILLEQYDIIGFLDNFASFMETLRKKLRLRHAYKNEKVNVTQDRPHLETIEPAVITAIEEVNYMDILFYRKIRQALVKSRAVNASPALHAIR